MRNIGIVGAGYAGVQIAQALMRNKEYSITLFDRNSYHQLITRLPDVVGGSLSPKKVAIPLTNLVSSDVHVRIGEVTLLDIGTRTVHVAGKHFTFDVLVVAVGTRPSPPGQMVNPGVHTVKSLDGAVALRNSLRSLTNQSRAQRITIVGAGYTGTEVAGEICTWGSKQRLNLQITMLSDESRVMPGASLALSHATERILRGKGVVVRLNSPVVNAAANAVVLRDGDVVESDIVVWAGASASAIPTSTATISRAGPDRVEVDPYFRAADEDVYFVGDAALVPDFRHGGFLPASAQMAVQHGESVARNLASLARGARASEFRPRILGEALTFGDGDAVGEVGGLVVTGRVASGIKSAALFRYLSRVGGPSLTTAYL